MSQGKFWKDLFNSDASGWNPKVKLGSGRYKWFNGPKGNNKAAARDEDRFALFQKHAGMISDRIDTVNEQFGQQAGFLSEGAKQQRQASSFETFQDIRQRVNAIGNTGLASSGSGFQDINLSMQNNRDRQEGINLNLRQNMFGLGQQKESEIFGLKGNVLDLYASMQAGRENLKNDPTKGFNIESYVEGLG